jgi:ParB-like chromosome segregation protein Spo0J
MKIETLKIADLTFDPTNARIHDDHNLQAIQGSLSQFGQRKPVVITHENVIVAGNGTVQAATLLGWDTVSAVRVPADWSEDQVKAFALADNRTAELADWNHVELSEQLTELSLADWDVKSLGFGEYQILDVRPDEVDDPFSLLEDTPRKDATQMTFTLSLEQAENVKQVLAQAKHSDRLPDDEENQNTNGNALFLVVSEWPG